MQDRPETAWWPEEDPRELSRFPCGAQTSERSLSNSGICG
jgi:hypothetical protein